MNNEKIRTYGELNIDEKEVLDSFRKMKLMYDHARFKLRNIQVEDLIKDYEELKKLREEIQVKYFSIYEDLLADDLIEGELDASQGKGSNCVDWGHVYYRIAKSLGYDVQFVHVKCRVSGTGQIRLRLRHKKHTGGNWINRNPATVADTTSGNVRAIWCEDGYLIAYNPSWIFTDLYSS